MTQRAPDQALPESVHVEAPFSELTFVCLIQGTVSR